MYLYLGDETDNERKQESARESLREKYTDLPYNTVDNVQAGDLVLRLALLDEFLYALHYVLVELDGSDGPLGDGGHLGLVKRDVYAMIRVANPYFLDPGSYIIQQKLSCSIDV